jgi:TonB family protein
MLVAGAVLSGGCASRGARSAGNTAPPAPVKTMPPIPDLSKVRTFTSPIPGLPTGKVGLADAVLRQLGDLKYPQTAWNTGLQGWAVYDFVVAPDGSVDPKYVRLVKASDPMFAKPAEDAVRAARFTPASQNGKAVPSLVRLPVYFSLEKANRRD